MKRLKINGKYSNGAYIIVDDDVYEKYGNRSWQAMLHTDGYKRGIYARRTIKGKTVTLHRLIMDAPKGLEVDHIDGNTLDCRRQNLRICTREENQRNKRGHGKSGIKGVRKHGDKYTARIVLGGKDKHLGSFETADEARLAYNTAATSNWGNYARVI